DVSPAPPPAVPSMPQPIATTVNQAPTRETPPPAFMPRVFVSHTSADNDFGHDLVRRLRDTLGGEDAVWYDSAPGRGGTGLIPGDEWWNRITGELATRNVFLIILSPDSMNSAWCRDELTLAWKDKNARDPARRKVIIPVLYRTCVMPEYLLTVQMADFTNAARFEQALEGLLSAVRAGSTIEAPAAESGPPFDLALLPVPAHFVGREQELAFLRERLSVKGSTSGIAAVNGLGGIGKTGLAARVIRELRDA